MTAGKLFLDFDGTLVSNKKRLYRFFRENIEPEFRNVLTINEFWNLKRLGINEIDWLNSQFSADLNLSLWNKKKLEEIEEWHYLSYDILFPASPGALDSLSTRFEIILVSRRSNADNFYKELDSFGLRKYFSDIILIPHNGEPKSTWITNRYKNIQQNELLVGDTEDDMRAGLALGLRTFFVLSGIRGPWMIQKYFANEKHKIKMIPSIKTLERYIGQEAVSENKIL